MSLNDFFKEILGFSYETISGTAIDRYQNRNLIDIFNNKLSKSLGESIGDENFTINPYFGKKNWVNTPIVKISHKDFLGTNFYLGYIFKSDFSGFYLALFNKLNWDFHKRVYDYTSNDEVLKVSREKLRSNFSKEVVDGLTEKIDLKNRGFPKKYVDACIFAKEYTVDLPSDDILKEDLDEFIDLYLFLAKNYDSEIITVDEWKSVLNSGIIAPTTFDLLKVIKSYDGVAYQKDISINEFENNYIDYANEDFITTEVYEDVYDISNFLSKKILISDFGRRNFYNCLFYGRILNDDLEIILRSELFEALDEEDIVNIKKYLDEGVQEEKKVNVAFEEKPTFYEYLLEKGYFFNKYDIENFLLSIKVKAFVLLTGNSGTGKTKLVQLFSQYIGEYYRTDLVSDDYNSEFSDVNLVDNLDKNLIYHIIPVGANWTENRHIVGYFNIITNKYQRTPAYDLLKISNKYYNDPHFLILDEMNLSHVERYFADFLSAIESGEQIPLYGEEELTLPSNLFIIGTVNVDETTYMFSPKVLDRANVIEFETSFASDYMKNKINLSSPSGNISYLENPLAGNEIRDFGIDELRYLFTDITADGKSFWNLLSNEIYEFQEILKESGFDFGFRVINEIVRFMAVAWEYEDRPKEFNNWKRYFDACIKQKLLPKLHGSEKIIGETLDKLYAKCLDNTIDTVDMAKYPESYKKLKEMREVLRKQRYVSFIN